MHWEVLRKWLGCDPSFGEPLRDRVSLERYNVSNLFTFDFRIERLQWALAYATDASVQETKLQSRALKTRSKKCHFAQLRSLECKFSQAPSVTMHHSVNSTIYFSFHSSGICVWINKKHLK